MIMPIIHCMKNAPTNNKRLKDVRAFPALVNEKAIPTAGWDKDKNIDATTNNDQCNAPALGPR